MSINQFCLLVSSVSFCFNKHDTKRPPSSNVIHCVRCTQCACTERRGEAAWCGSAAQLCACTQSHMFQSEHMVGFRWISPVGTGLSAVSIRIRSGPEAAPRSGRAPGSGDLPAVPNSGPTVTSGPLLRMARPILFHSLYHQPPLF